MKKRYIALITLLLLFGLFFTQYKKEHNIIKENLRETMVDILKEDKEEVSVNTNTIEKHIDDFKGIVPDKLEIVDYSSETTVDNGSDKQSKSISVKYEIKTVKNLFKLGTLNMSINKVFKGEEVVRL